MFFVVFYKVFPYKIGEAASVLFLGVYMARCMALAACPGLLSAAFCGVPAVACFLFRACSAALLLRNAKRSDCEIRPLTW